MIQFCIKLVILSLIYNLKNFIINKTFNNQIYKSDKLNSTLTISKIPDEKINIHIFDDAYKYNYNDNINKKIEIVDILHILLFN